MEVLDSARALFSNIPFNIFDYAFIILFAFYVYEEVSFGAKNALSHAGAIVGGFLFGILFYSQTSRLFTTQFGVSKGIADAVAFFLVALISYFLISRIIFYLSKEVSGVLPRNTSKILAGLAGAVSFLFIAAFVISVFLSFPIALPIKNAIQQSVTSRFILAKTQNLELTVKEVFSDTIDETLNFLTVKPNSDGTVELHFTVENGTVDRSSEIQMIDILNQTRKQFGLNLLEEDENLTEAARLHGKDMFIRGYFSHYTPEGYTPFDRLENLSISYLTAAENLAYAPEVDLAFSGLMKSEGHRKNILDPNFNKVGIGVIDGGIHGKMFVQEFTD